MTEDGNMIRLAPMEQDEFSQANARPSAKRSTIRSPLRKDCSHHKGRGDWHHGGDIRVILQRATEGKEEGHRRDLC